LIFVEIHRPAFRLDYRADHTTWRHRFRRAFAMTEKVVLLPGADPYSLARLSWRQYPVRDRSCRKKEATRVRPQRGR
jgi:hypothetical protein